MSSNLRVNSIVPASGTNVAIGTAGGTITYGASVSGVSTFTTLNSTNLNVGAGGTVITTTAGGNVGIGTNTTSLGKLEIHAPGSTNHLILKDSTNNWVSKVQVSTAGTFTIKSGDTETLRIDTSGRVTMPYQPHAEGGINSGSPNTTPTSSEIIRFNRADVNVGGHYDTSQYRFNCPVTGNYLVHAHVQTNGQTATTANTVNFNIRKNGASVSGVYESRYYGASAPGYVKLEINDVVYATAGDYLDIYAIISGTSLSLEYGSADIRWRFSYTLLG